MEPLPFALAVVGFLFVMGALLLPRIRRRRRKPVPARPGNFDFVPTPTEEARLNDARELLIRIEEFSNRSFARVDTRMRTLNRLIEDADVRIRQLEQEGRNDR